MNDPTDKRCPECGVGVLVDIAFDLRDEDVEREGHAREIRQEGNSHQITRYSCGHEVPGPGMETSDADRLDVERRKSEETA